MKRINNILGIFTLAMILMVASGCSKESLIDEPISSEEKVRLRINTDNGEFQAPSTRAIANETNIDDVWVLVFKGSDYNAPFVEAVKSTVTGSDRFVVLTQSTGAHKLLVVANADAIISAKKASLTANVTTLTAAISILQYGNPYNATTAGDGTLANQQMAMPFAEPAKSIPMSEVLSVSGINSTTEINATGAAGGAALQLSRITAKVVVDGSDVFDKFKINQVAAYQGARSTVSLVPGNSGTVQTGGTFINYYKGSITTPTEICTGAIAAANAAQNNTEAFPVYVYESTGTANFIIIKATLDGSVVGYHKLRLAKPDGTNYEIKRNYKYIFKIVSVVDNVSSGYSTLKAAIDGAESNIAGKIIVVSEGNSADIIDNGTYYLGCSNSEFLVYADGEKSNLTALTITTNATAAMIGGVNSITATTTSGTAMTVSPSAINLNTGGAAQGTETKVTVTLPAGFTNSSVGTITLKLGNLVKTISVRRQPMLSHAAASKEFATNYVSGKVTAGGAWLSLGLVNDPAQGSAQVTHPDQQGSVYLFTKNNIGIRTGGEVYLARHNNQGRVKIYVEQNGAFPAYPGVIGYDPVRGDLNLQGRGVMVYFKYGGIIAMYAGVNGYEWKTDGSPIAFNPTDITVGAYNSFPRPIRTDYGTVGNTPINDAYHSNPINARNGNGDPCRFINSDGSGMTAAEVKAALASGTDVPYKTYWRLPTNAENELVSLNETTWVQRGSSLSDPTTLRNGHTFSGLNKGNNHSKASWNFLPANGDCYYSNGSVSCQGELGLYWSSTPSGYNSGFDLYFDNSITNPNISHQSNGRAVRCVSNVPPSFPAYPGVIGYDPDTETLNLDGKGVMVYFKYGSLVAMYAGLNGDKWSSDDIAFNPSNITDFSAYTSVPYAKSATFPTQNIAAGLGDPCNLVGYKTSELTGTPPSGSAWRLPTNAENKLVSVNEDTWVQRGSEHSDPTLRNGHTFSKLNKGSNHSKESWNFLPAAGRRSNNDGAVFLQGAIGHYWSSTPSNAAYGYHLHFSYSSASPSSSSNQSFGLAIRCVSQP